MGWKMISMKLKSLSVIQQQSKRNECENCIGRELNKSETNQFMI